MHEVQAILLKSTFALRLPPYGYVGVKNKWRNVFVPSAGTTLWNIEEIWTPSLDPNHVCLHYTSSAFVGAASTWGEFIGLFVVYLSPAIF